MDKRTRLRRLNHAVEVMEAVPPIKFEIDSWRDTTFFDKPRKVKVPDTFVEVSCTTAACFLGWAAMDKKFIKSGLAWKKIGAKQCNYQVITLNGRESSETGIGAKFFGINRKEAEDLFYGDNYQAVKVKPRNVIVKLKKLINKYS